MLISTDPTDCLRLIPAARLSIFPVGNLLDQLYGGHKFLHMAGIAGGGADFVQHPVVVSDVRLSDETA